MAMHQVYSWFTTNCFVKIKYEGANVIELTELALANV